MTPTLDAANLRRWAMQCATQAENLGTREEERARLLRMRESLIELADNDDWLHGIRRPTYAQESDAAIQSLAERRTGISPSSKSGKTA